MPPSCDDSKANRQKAYCVLALYRFVSEKWSTEHVKDLQVAAEGFLREHKARGTILLAPEGVNGTICYLTEHGSEIEAWFQEKFPGLRSRQSYTPDNVFFKLKVRIKSEIVTMGLPQVAPREKVGTYVEPGEEWDKLVNDPDCLVIDARNDYEVLVGTFRNAENPQTTSFVEFPSWLENRIAESKPSKVAMFCTGGIRCEKASSYCMNLVNDEIPVYHLQGGILAYLAQVPPDESTFEGECYVFDQRTAVTHGLEPSETYTLCRACRHPLTPKDREQRDFEQGVSCAYCSQDENRLERRQRYVDRQHQVELSSRNHFPHLHDGKEWNTAPRKDQLRPSTASGEGSMESSY